MAKASTQSGFDVVPKRLEGKIAWTVLYVPKGIAETLGGPAGGGRIAVQGQVDGHKFRGTLLPSRNGHYLVFNQAMRDACGKGLGELVHVVLEPDAGDRPVELPADVMAALERNTAAEKTFAGLPPYRRREEITKITSAKQEQTRRKRIAQLVETLAGTRVA